MELSSRFSAVGFRGLQVLSEDDGVAFCRGWRNTTEGRRNGVLVMLPTLEQPTPAILDRLAHEYSFKDELDSTWAVRPLELERDRGHTILVFEDPGGLILERTSEPRELHGRFLEPLSDLLALCLGQIDLDLVRVTRS
jgi:hypothetical protein